MVTGLGMSGEAAARVLVSHGALVHVYDDAANPSQQAAAIRLAALGVEVTLGGLPAVPPEGTGLVVTSPGLRPSTPLFVASGQARIPVWGEVELAWRLRPAGQEWLAITGTNGKTTTTQMLGAILAAAGIPSATAGNIGAPLVDVAVKAHQVLAVELSSFQLHYTRTLAPRAGVVLNLAADHLDWHGSMQAYAADKARVWGPDAAELSADGTTAIVNGDDPAVVALRGDRPYVTFALAGGGVTVENGYLVDHAFGGGRLIAGRRPGGSRIPQRR